MNSKLCVLCYRMPSGIVCMTPDGPKLKTLIQLMMQNGESEASGNTSNQPQILCFTPEGPTLKTLIELMMQTGHDPKPSNDEGSAESKKAKLCD